MSLVSQILDKPDFLPMARHRLDGRLDTGLDWFFEDDWIQNSALDFFTGFSGVLDLHSYMYLTLLSWHSACRKNKLQSQFLI